MVRTRAITFVCSLLLLVLSWAAPAWSQDSRTWLPDFNPSQNVYVDTRLSGDRLAPVDFSGLARLIPGMQEANGLQIYVIATKQGSDLSGAGMATRKLEELQNRWAGLSNFPREKSLVCLWVRRADDANRGSVACVGGNWLRSMNMGSAYFNSEAGPLRDFGRFMPGDPAGAVGSIINHVNADISAQLFEAQKPMMYLIAFVAVVIFGIIGFFVFFHFRSRSILLEWEKKIAAASEMYIKLNGEYLEFLGRQSNWKQTLKGASYDRYAKALKDFADFSARFLKARDLAVKARGFFDTAPFPYLSAAFRIRSLLVKSTVTVTGDELPIETATLFGGLVEKTDYTPQTLLDSMAALFASTNASLAAIKTSFVEAEKNRGDMDKMIAGVEAARKDLEVTKLPFKPYGDRLSAMMQERDSILAMMESDPETANQKSDQLEGQLQALAADIKRAIGLKTGCDTLETALAEAKAHFAGMRAKPFVYAYPLGEGETAPANVAQALFTLTEDSGNPDDSVAQADSQLAKARELLVKADLDNSDSALRRASDSQLRAMATAQRVVESKSWIESKGVGAARQAYSGLRTELPSASGDLTKIQDDFARHIDKHLDNVGVAELLVNSQSTRVMAEVKSLYDSQNFLAARAKLEEHIRDLSQSTQNMRNVRARLAGLIKIKKDTLELLEQFKNSLQALSGKLQRASFSTSQKTVDRYTTVNTKVGELVGTSKVKAPDWDELLAQTRASQTEISAIDQAITQEEADYSAAKSSVTALNTAVTTAGESVDGRYTRKPARDLFAQAEAAQRSLSSKIRTARSDWKQIKKDADDAAGKAKQAAQKAAEDASAAREASQAISTAESHIQSVSNKNYDWNVSADTSDAKRKLGQAKSQFSNGEYENAKGTADDAHDAATSADTRAKREVSNKEEADRQSKIVIVPSGGSPGPFSGGGTLGGGSQTQVDNTPSWTQPADNPVDTGAGGRDTPGDTGVGGKDY